MKTPKVILVAALAALFALNVYWIKTAPVAGPGER